MPRLFLALIFVFVVVGVGRGSYAAPPDDFMYSDSNSHNLPPSQDAIQFPITVPDSFPSPGIVAEVTVTVRIRHEHFNTLSIVVKSPNNIQAVPIKSPNTNLSQNNQDVTFTNGYQFSSEDNLKKFCGLQAQGDWLLEITKGSQAPIGSGTLYYWSLEIAYAQLGSLQIANEEFALALQVDGYGSFGDQGYRSQSQLSGRYPLDSSIVGTVFQSAMFVHDEQRFLTSLDHFPGMRLPSVDLRQTDSQTLHSRFQLPLSQNRGIYDINLVQRLVEENSAFALYQIYTFTSTEPSPRDLYLTRYINPYFNDSGGIKNYAALLWRESLIDGMYVFDEVQSGTQDISRYVGIQNRTEQGQELGYSNSAWFSDGRILGSDLLKEEKSNFYRKYGLNFQDNNKDQVTDPQNGFDVALAWGTKLIFDANRQARFTAVTRWGYSSPALVLSATDEIMEPTIPIEPTSTPEPPTATPTWTATETPTWTATETPTWTATETPTRTATETWTPTVTPTNTIEPTDTPTPSATPSAMPSNTPTFSPTVTNTPGAPYWLADLPDIRLELNRPADAVLDLDDYLSDPDTPSFALQWNLDNPNQLPVRLDSEHRLSFGAISKAGDYGEIQVAVTDGVRLATASIRVKVSTSLLRSFRSVPPIVMGPGEITYTSPYRLSDYLIATPSETNARLQWFVPPTLPPGMESVEIHSDSSFTLTVDESLAHSPSWLPIGVRLVTVTPTPIVTPSPTALSISTPSATLTPLPTSTATSTPSWTQTFTPTRTPTATASTTSTATPRPPSTATPTPTIPLNCVQSLVLRPRTLLQTGLGPFDWLPTSSLLGEPPGFLVTHFYEDSLGLYQPEGTGYATQALPGVFGFSQIELGDFNGDGQQDIAAINPLDESLQFYLSSSANPFTAPFRVDLSIENNISLAEGLNTANYQVIASGAVLSDASDELLLLTRDALLVLSGRQNQPIRKRYPLGGIARLLQKADVNRDGLMDVMVGMRDTQGQEWVRVLVNRQGEYVETDSLSTDDAFHGNFARQLIIQDLNLDQQPDLLMLDFADVIHAYLGKGDGTFEPAAHWDLFPPGVVKAIVVGDLNGDDQPELIVLHFSQAGLVLYAVCGNSLASGPQMASWPISGDIHISQQFRMRLVDFDSDQDLDVLISRSAQDDIISYENQRLSRP